MSSTQPCVTPITLCQNPEFNTLPVLRYSGTQLVKPQFDASGMLWTIDNTDGGPVAVRVGQQGDAIGFGIGAVGHAPGIQRLRAVRADMRHTPAPVGAVEIAGLGGQHTFGADQAAADGHQGAQVGLRRGLRGGEGVRIH